MTTNTRIALAGIAVAAAIVATLGLADKIDRWGDSEAGFERSDTACVVRMKRLGIARGGDGSDAWSATALAKLMGVDSSTVTKRWIALEGLPAKKRGTERTAVQGGDEWLITRSGLRTWLKDHAQCIDLRKVDKFFFWSVVFN